MPRVSVIVPMYNAEKFLDMSVSSILQQTFDDMEIILVDDCSTDKTLEIAKSFGDSRIKILRTEKNLGYPGAVRNVGLDVAVGDYVFFMDHDDLIFPDAFEKLVALAEKNNSDVVTTSTWQQFSLLPTKEEKITNEDEIYFRTVDLKFSPTVSKDLKMRLWQELVLQRMHVAPWCSLYRRKFLAENEIRFPAEVVEDVFFTVDVLFATDKISKVDFPFYAWRYSKNSASQNVNRAYKNMKSILNLHDFLQKKLEPLNDDEFTAEFIFSQISGAMRNYLEPLFKFDLETSRKVLEEIMKAIEPRFGKNSLLMRTILRGYFLGYDAII